MRHGEVILSPRAVKQKLEPEMYRSLFILVTSTLVLSACQPAPSSGDPVEAETPPLVIEETVTETVTDVHDDDHEGEEHDDEEHEGEEHAGGEAHVHGHAELAISIERNVISLSLEAPLDNFGLSESQSEIEDTSVYTDGIVDLVNADCARDASGVELHKNGDHASMIIDLSYICLPGTMATAVEITAFRNFEGFEEIDAVILTESGQTAAALTAADTRLDLP